MMILGPRVYAANNSHFKSTLILRFFRHKGKRSIELFHTKYTSHHTLIVIFCPPSEWLGRILGRVGRLRLDGT